MRLFIRQQILETGPRLCLLLLTLCSALILPGCDDPVRNDVKAAQLAVDIAIGRQDGDTAVNLLSASSAKYLDNIMNLARTANKPLLSRETIEVQAYALIARVMYQPEDLRNKTGLQFYRDLVKKGWTPTTESFTISKIRFDTSKTQAIITFRDPESRGTCEGMFVLEGGQWKQDFATLAKREDKRTRQAYRQQKNMSGKEAVIGWVTEATGEQVPTNIWDVPRQ